MRSFMPLASFLLLLCDLYRNGLLCDAFSRTTLISQQTRQVSTRTASFLKAEIQEETTEETEKSTASEPITLYELAEMEARASKRINDRLMLPQRIGRVFWGAVYFFAIFGVVLNIFGYGYIRGQNGSITIGTLEERNFQVEMAKSMRETMENSVGAVTKSQIEVDAAAMTK